MVGKLRYVCPPGQRLNSDFLLCCKPLTFMYTYILFFVFMCITSLSLTLPKVSCEKGYFSSETDRSRVVNGVGFSETVPVFEVCPLNSYADTVGSPVCSHCPRYHTTSFTGATSLQDCSREFRLALSQQIHFYFLSIFLKHDF